MAKRRLRWWHAGRGVMVIVVLALLAPAVMRSAAGPARGEAPAEPPFDPSRPVLEEETTALAPQVSAPSTAAPEPLSQAPVATARCPEKMIYVAGQFCPTLAHACREYSDERMDRCKSFTPTSRCFGADVPLEFCIDRFEYPNVEGGTPWVGVTWLEARGLCEAQGKRLCSSDEWSLACEGPGRLPYPYGYERSSDACNIDKPYRIPDDNAYANLATRKQEIARLDQREPSGHRAACVSGYGVFDMTGNVDEWVTYPQGALSAPPYKSSLKGGYWGPVRNRCRPMTTSHNQWHSGYQIGFRCCATPPS